MPSPATILITARNAESTIARAIRSALAQGDYPVVLVDDYSTDGTVDAARAVAGGRLRIVRPAHHETLGLARQTGLSAVETPFAVWVDADDEMLPGRVSRLVQVMEAERSQIAADAVELIDGVTGAFVRQLPMPAFLIGQHPAARLFERNYLPGTGCVCFDTEAARRIGFDVALESAEDIDFILRAVAAGARMSFVGAVGYRLYAYPHSMSRRREDQRRNYRAALRKHSYESVELLYRHAGQSSRVTAWGLASLAVFREDWSAALTYLDEAGAAMTGPLEVLEPDGPCPLPEGWRLGFQRGTVLLLSGRAQEAVAELERAERIHRSAEGANNLGVAMARCGRAQEAGDLFALSLIQAPSFLDARLNLEASIPEHVTRHPLRVIPNRADYSS